MTQGRTPEILAPAGNTDSFLAALAAGADAIYAGLKHFSARMEAKNFSLTELAGLTTLAHAKGTRVYIALNTLIKPSDTNSTAQLIHKIHNTVKPDALIFQDMGLIPVARQTGYTGQIHLSTLAAITSPSALTTARSLGADRVVLPRELTIDEIRTCAHNCPPGLSIEIFVQGALCYNVSGRCYWSSFMGGKSGLRGRCVQPCRRVYDTGKRTARFFSCQDLQVDVLTRGLLTEPAISAWKIEGRKKSPHYVYYTVTAYKLLQDKSDDSTARKTALSLLEQALGRPSSHANFLPQRPQIPTDPAKHSASGQFIGKTGTATGRKQHFITRQPLLAGDRLRIGYEEDTGHQLLRIPRALPKGGRFDFVSKGKGPQPGTGVFLIDRREKELSRALDDLKKELAACPPFQQKTLPAFTLTLPAPVTRKKVPTVHLNLFRFPPQGQKRDTTQTALWLRPGRQESTQKGRQKKTGNMQGASRAVWWWLPPVIWPDEEQRFADTLRAIMRKGASRFVLNAPWQRALFPENLSPTAAPEAKGYRKKKSSGRRYALSLWAGPFCNISNALTLAVLQQMGFTGAIISPELPKEALLALPGQSPLPLGIVTAGLWPLGLTRIPTGEIKTAMPLKSPQGEVCWVKPHGTTNWIFPNWQIDLQEKQPLLYKAGYQLLVHMHEPIPRTIRMSPRTSRFNWDAGLL